jgi:hypothetical protein
MNGPRPAMKGRGSRIYSFIFSGTKFSKSVPELEFGRLVAGRLLALTKSECRMMVQVVEGKESRQ